MEKIDLFTLISLIVAVVVILKLRSVLGRRTGDEEARVERYRAERAQQGAAGFVNRQRRRHAAPRARRRCPAPVAEETQADAEERIKTYPGVEAAARNGLIDVARLDPAFDPDTFIRGAKQAYEMIVTAFAEGNRKLLEGSPQPRRVRRASRAPSPIARAARSRSTRASSASTRPTSWNSEVKSGIASITVRFVSQLISATRDKAGAIINGDPQRIKEVTDIWTFSRDISSAKARANPNWRLIATQSPA